MRFWKHSLLAAGIFMGIASTVTYTSCTNDSCRAIICRNGGTCADEACRCPDGFEGSQCETVSRLKFFGTYDGITKVNGEPTIRDSVYVFQELDDTTGQGISVNIFSRPGQLLSGKVLGDEVIVNEPGKNVTFKMIGTNRIEIVIDEKVDGKRFITNFQGDKRTIED